MRWGAGVLAITVLVSGCASVVPGVGEPATAAVKILPTEDEITSAVGNALRTFGFQPFIGGAEILPDGYRTDADATPIACAAVTDTAPRIVYEPLPVLEAARQSYFNWDEGVDTSGADAAVVRLSTVEAARDAFASFAEAWRKCGDTTVVKHLRLAGPSAADTSTETVIDADIGDVTADGSMLAATVVTQQRPGAPRATYQRALGVRGDAIVEISLAITPAGEKQPDPRGRAVRAAQVMLDKAGAGR